MNITAARRRASHLGAALRTAKHVFATHRYAPCLAAAQLNVPPRILSHCNATPKAKDMTVRIFLLATAFALPLAAHAQNSNGNVGGWHVQTGPNGANSPRAASLAAAAATTGASTSSATGGSASGGSATATGASGGGASSNNDNRSYAIGLPSYAAAAGPCIGVSTMIGGAFLGTGGTVGRTEIEEECQVRDAARILLAAGQIGEAVALIRSLPSVRKAQQAMAQPAPAPRAVVAEPLPPVAQVVAAPACPDFGYALSAADRARYPGCR